MIVGIAPCRACRTPGMRCVDVSGHKSQGAIPICENCMREATAALARDYKTRGYDKGPKST